MCLSYPLLFSFHFHLNLELNLFLHVDVIGAISQLRSLAFWPNSRLSQVASPSSLTTSTIRRILRSSRTNPATQCPRTCLTRNSTRPSGKRSLHNCSGEEPVDRRQACHSCEESWLPALSISVTQERGRPVDEPSSPSSCREKPSRDSMSESGFSLNDKKSKFSLILESRFKNTSSKPIVEEVPRN